jgi:segregation and condensation protein B
MEDIAQEFSVDRLKAAIECMLFVTPQPLTIKQISEALTLDEATVEKALQDLRMDYASGRGLQILHIAGGYQMCTKPEFVDCITALLKPTRTRMSRAALETVAIIAYRQPITQPEIDAIRGVNSDGVVKTLMEKNLLAQVGRKDSPGRPILYGTTPEFLNHFGLSDLSYLPELTDVELPAPDQAVLPMEQPAEAQGE